MTCSVGKRAVEFQAGWRGGHGIGEGSVVRRLRPKASSGTAEDSGRISANMRRQQMGQRGPGLHPFPCGSSSTGQQAQPPPHRCTLTPPQVHGTASPSSAHCTEGREGWREPSGWLVEYLHFSGAEAEAQRGQVTCLKSHRETGAELDQSSAVLTLTLGLVPLGRLDRFDPVGWRLVRARGHPEAVATARGALGFTKRDRCAR